MQNPTGTAPAVSTLDDRHGKSRELLARASQFVPGGVHSGRRKLEPPMCVKRAAGAYIEDMDGRRYLDYHAAYAPILLGHCYPDVVDRVSAAIRETQLFAVGTTELEAELAEKIVGHLPSVEQVLFCGSGSESTMYAIRLSRAVTRRETIIKFQGCYDGFHDYVQRTDMGRRESTHDAGADMAATTDAYLAIGIPAQAIENTLVCRFNDVADVEAAFAEAKDGVACVIVEPMMHNATTIRPQPGFLEFLREVCDRNGALLVFDEVITGFRHALGGYQSIAGVMPDLTCMGKALGNGFPVAALGGRAEHMERFTTTEDGDVWYGGSYNGNTAGMAAGLATLEVLENEPVHEHIYSLGDRMRAGLEEVARRVDVPATVLGFGSVFVMAFIDGPVVSYDDYLRNDTELFLTYRREMIARGIFEMPETVGRNHISYSHTVEDVDRTLEVSELALRAALDRRGSGGVGSGR